MEYIEIYSKIIVAFIGIVAGFTKIKESFKPIKMKEELKLDLDILEKLKSLNSNSYEKIKTKVENKTIQAYEANSNNYTNFVTGIATFIGFGFWTVDIITTSYSFNGWAILTLAFSLIGFTLIIEGNTRKKEKSVFLTLNFYDQVNFRFGFFLMLFAGIITSMLIYYKIFSFWLFFSALFTLIGIFSIIKNIQKG